MDKDDKQIGRYFHSFLKTVLGRVLLSLIKVRTYGNLDRCIKNWLNYLRARFWRIKCSLMDDSSLAALATQTEHLKVASHGAVVLSTSCSESWRHQTAPVSSCARAYGLGFLFCLLTSWSTSGWFVLFFFFRVRTVVRRGSLISTEGDSAQKIILQKCQVIQWKDACMVIWINWSVIVLSKTKTTTKRKQNQKRHGSTSR